ncbi:Rap GTPase activating protein domain [Trinorchestia longiramus]|nr:Rap GTPase activating protein domain [Trinorchestia longiramus]
MPLPILTANPLITRTTRPLTTCIARPLTTCIARPLTTRTALPLTTCIARPLTTRTARPLTTRTALPLTTCIARPLTTCIARPLTTRTARPLTTCTARPLTTLHDHSPLALHDHSPLALHDHSPLALHDHSPLTLYDIFALVTYNSDDGSYRLHVYSEESVPLFGPSLSGSCVFHNHDEFREFLLVKLINGEKATLNTPTFSQKRERTLDMLIRDLYQEHINDTRGTMLNRRAFSDVLPDPPKSSRRKEEARQVQSNLTCLLRCDPPVEFVRFGQALKLDTIVKGDAPTSLATTGLFKRTLTGASCGPSSSACSSPTTNSTSLHARPWEPECYYPDFPSEVGSGDSWGDSRLMVAPLDGGVYLLEEGAAHRQLFDRSVAVKQLSCVEAHGILLLRVDKGRDSKVHVFRLTDFDCDSTSPNFEERIRSKADLKDHKLERTKGCHLYAISRPGGSHLRMVVCVGRKLVVLQWRHSAAWTAWCPGSDTDTVDGFQYLREISVSDVPSLITLVDSSPAPSAGGVGDNHICVGYKHQWDLVSEKSGELTKLHHVDANKVNLVAAIDIYEDDEAELLLCYNNTCHFQKLTEDCSTDFDFQWNSVPEAIVCAFPYILAFTHDSIEIRLVINGNLVQTMVMPNLTFITNKSDIFFATTAPEFFSLRQERVTVDRMEKEPSLSPPSSPQNSKDLSDRDASSSRPYRIYRIPFRSLTGASCERRCPTPTTSMATGLLNDSDSSNRDRKDRAKDTKGASRAGMHLRVSDQHFSSRSCSTSPTHQLAAPCFPTVVGGDSSTPTEEDLGGLESSSGCGSAKASPTRSRPVVAVIGDKSPKTVSPGRSRNRTNSLTVEMSGANHFKHFKIHMPHHHKVKHPPLQHHPTLK